MNADTHEIVAVELTPDDIGDVSAVPLLLDQIESEIGSVTADGAYDGEPVYDVVTKRYPNAAIIIPPRATAVTGDTPKQRDQHIETIAQHGRMGWQDRSGYNRRSLIETAMFRYKTVIGRRLHARSLPNQRSEAKAGCNALNKMPRLGMPVSVRIR
jgi:transposase